MKEKLVYEKEVRKIDIKTWITQYKMYILAGGALAAFGLYQLTAEETSPEIPAVEEAVPAGESMAPVPAPPLSEPQEPAVLMVDIKGAVAAPGIYSLKNGERINDAITKAGGFQKEADRTAINLAQKLQDEMIIYVPKVGETPPEEAAGAAVPEKSTVGHSAGGGAALNINKASVEELQQLPGIGKAKAQAIIDYRETIGAFTKPDDLKSVSGIGDKTFEKLAPLVVVQ
ncbi:Late competence protein ComEA, DNA receptor [Bacillus badius]|uniref:Late competence protein ComEA, DNA receptor n=1 Tax=Bacillus badius TaxID=1455 RepID=A0ABR5AY19_BACBA|nr:Late competence protein ComEA, DNA receptor [Bacillus badius]